MKKIFLISSLLFLFTNLVYAQSEKDTDKDRGMSKFTLHVEVGTNIAVSSTSLNFEGLIGSSPSGKVHWYGRAGLGGSAIFYGPAGWGGLGGLTMLTGKGKHHFEAGVGVFVGNDTGFGMGDGVFALPLVDLGYRYQKPGSSFIFRAKAGVLCVGIGLGYAF